MMSTRAIAATGNRRKSRLTSFAWIAGVVVITTALLVWEQIALLYVLATLAVTVLLIVVARADLDGVRNLAATPPRPADDSAALGDNLNNQAALPVAGKTATANASSRPRTRNAKRR